VENQVYNLSGWLVEMNQMLIQSSSELENSSRTNSHCVCLIKAISLSGDHGCSFAHDVIQDTIYQHFPLRTAPISKYIHGTTCGCKEWHLKTISALRKPSSSRGSNNSISGLPNGRRPAGLHEYERLQPSRCCATGDPR
jgi:hypothetical protein